MATPHARKGTPRPRGPTTKEQFDRNLLQLAPETPSVTSEDDNFTAFPADQEANRMRSATSTPKHLAAETMRVEDGSTSTAAATHPSTALTNSLVDADHCISYPQHHSPTEIQIFQALASGSTDDGEHSAGSRYQDSHASVTSGESEPSQPHYGPLFEPANNAPNYIDYFKDSSPNNKRHEQTLPTCESSPSGGIVPLEITAALDWPSMRITGRALADLQEEEDEHEPTAVAHGSLSELGNYSVVHLGEDELSSLGESYGHSPGSKLLMEAQHHKRHAVGPQNTIATARSAGSTLAASWEEDEEKIIDEETNNKTKGKGMKLNVGFCRRMPIFLLLALVGSLLLMVMAGVMLGFALRSQTQAEKEATQLSEASLEKSTDVWLQNSASDFEQQQASSSSAAPSQIPNALPTRTPTNIPSQRPSVPPSLRLSQRPSPAPSPQRPTHVPILVPSTVSPSSPSEMLFPSAPAEVIVSVESSPTPQPTFAPVRPPVDAFEPQGTFPTVEPTSLDAPTNGGMKMMKAKKSKKGEEGRWRRRQKKRRY